MPWPPIKVNRLWLPLPRWNQAGRSPSTSPMYSSGVFMALKSGELAADAINEAFEKDDFSAVQLSKWGDLANQGVQTIRKLVYAFYSKEFSFGRFIKTYPQHRDDVTAVLIGDVFRPNVDEVFKPMSTMAPIPESIQLEKPKAAREGEAERDEHAPAEATA